MKAAFACAIACLISTPVMAEEQTGATSPLVNVAPIQETPTQNAVLRAGTPVAFRLLEEVTTKKKSAHVGQRFQLEVAAPVEVNGVTVIPSGTPAWGEVTGVRNKGMWGKSGKLDARLLYLRANGRQIRLTGTFDDKGVTGTGAVVGSVALLPLAGFFMTGTSAMLPKGGAVNGFIDEDVVLAFKQAAPAPMQVPVSASPMTVPVDAAPVLTSPVATTDAPQTSGADPSQTALSPVPSGEAADDNAQGAIPVDPKD